MCSHLHVPNRFLESCSKVLLPSLKPLFNITKMKSVNLNKVDNENDTFLTKVVPSVSFLFNQNNLSVTGLIFLSVTFFLLE